MVDGEMPDDEMAGFEMAGFEMAGSGLAGDAVPGGGVPGESLEQRITRLRKERGLTQRRLSQLTSLPLDQIQAIEAIAPGTKRVPLKVLDDLAIQLLATTLNVAPYSFEPWTPQDLAAGRILLDWPFASVAMLAARRPGRYGKSQLVIVMTDLPKQPSMQQPSAQQPSVQQRSAQRRVELVADLPADPQTVSGFENFTRVGFHAMAHAGQLQVEFTGRQRDPDDT
jgi:transcriptional regulator with XRE-family HTH domain